MRVERGWWNDFDLRVYVTPHAVIDALNRREALRDHLATAWRHLRQMLASSDTPTPCVRAAVPNAPPSRVTRSEPDLAHAPPAATRRALLSDDVMAAA